MLVGAALVAGVAAVYGQTFEFGSVNFDDPDDATENPAVAGRFDKALRNFDAALAFEPENNMARQNKATVYLQLGITAAQAGAFREAARTDPTLAVAHRNLGLALMQVGELQEAEAAFRAALRIDPDDAPARANLEKVLGQMHP